ncbi:12210_t:CDS:1 [Ambispora gerdemannii]|uniref:12210_t:CDS:1 n=1 Tax=Ambispora gerdemannii TaxID=144530 RepID=A0A9N8ZS09_9GLOM|nr:12210_t:CDS:1 [Ambispora gerdemannii]
MKSSLFKALIFLMVLMLVIEAVVDASPIPKKKKKPKSRSRKHPKSSVSSGGSSTTSTPSGGTTSSGTGSHSGEGTYYNPGLGACGHQDDDSSSVVALAAPDFDPSTPNGNPNKNTLCGKRIRIYYNGKQVEGTVQDRCPECKAGDVDMSPTMFDAIADRSLGRIPITWDFI